MKQKELPKAFMMIKLKKTFLFSIVYIKPIQRFKGLGRSSSTIIGVQNTHVRLSSSIIINLLIIMRVCRHYRYYING